MKRIFKNPFFWTTAIFATVLFFIVCNCKNTSLAFIEVPADEILPNIIDCEPQEDITKLSSYIKKIDAAYAVEIAELHYKSYLLYCENTATVTYNADKKEWIVILDIKNSEDIYRIGIDANSGGINTFIKIRY